jgi:UDPglucose--hexose-1-phosphate uridylyltransferase
VEDPCGEKRLPELRKDPITGRWVIIATDRAKRPTDFVRESFEPKGGRICPFCPGHETKTPPEILAFGREGSRTLSEWTLRVVPNKFPALRVEGELTREGEGLYDKITGIGAHEVIIESPDHMSTLATMPEKRVEDLFWAFRERLIDLRKDTRLRYVLLFKNHGEAAGMTLEHTHSQLIALPVVPKRVQEELEGARQHYDYKERCVFCDIVRQERSDQHRIIVETDLFLAFAPYASRFPFECCVIPKRHASHFDTVTPTEMQNAAFTLQRLLQKIDKTLEKPAYNFMVHTSPLQDPAHSYYHWHIEVIPKLTRVAGFEWGTGFYINPTPPEEAASYLREA